jgi:VIT1/CCC1 family predicted Fe2+/Mn2+ transporter
MYLMNCLAARGRENDALRAMRSVRNSEEARQAISKALPEGIAAVLSPGERLQVRLRALPEPPARRRLEGDDWPGAAGVFCLVFLSTLPVILPFVLLSELALALRLSNLIAVCMLFPRAIFQAKHFRGATNHE